MISVKEPNIDLGTKHRGLMRRMKQSALEKLFPVGKNGVHCVRADNVKAWAGENLPEFFGDYEPEDRRTFTRKPPRQIEFRETLKCNYLELMGARWEPTPSGDWLVLNLALVLMDEHGSIRDIGEQEVFVAPRMIPYGRMVNYLEAWLNVVRDVLSHTGFSNTERVENRMLKFASPNELVFSDVAELKTPHSVSEYEEFFRKPKRLGQYLDRCSADGCNAELYRRRTEWGSDTNISADSDLTDSRECKDCELGDIVLGKPTTKHKAEIDSCYDYHETAHEGGLTKKMEVEIAYEQRDDS